MSQGTILVVDDEPSILKVVARLLEARQYRVLTARDGSEAFSKVQAERPDLIISDIEMPRMDGYTLVKKLRADPVLAKIPVIVLTGKDGMRDLFFFEGVPHYDYVVKPFESDQLLAKTSQLLDRVRTHLDPGAGPSPSSA